MNLPNTFTVTDLCPVGYSGTLFELLQRFHLLIGFWPCDTARLKLLEI